MKSLVDKNGPWHNFTAISRSGAKVDSNYFNLTLLLSFQWNATRRRRDHPNMCTENNKTGEDVIIMLRKVGCGKCQEKKIVL